MDIFDATGNIVGVSALSEARTYVAATTVGSLALFGGGFALGTASSVVDIFDASGTRIGSTTLSQARGILAATTVGNRALFGGGLTSVGVSNVVDIFELTDTCTWTRPAARGPGPWADEANWDSCVPPLPFDRVYINNGGTAQIATPGAVAQELRVSVGNSGRVEVLAGGSLTLADFLWSGVWGTGSLAVLGGGSVSNTVGILGYYGGSTGTATVDGPGSTWVNASNLNVGLQGTGLLTVQNGGTVSNLTGYVGYWNWPGSSGTATVTGTGSAWTNAADLYIGVEGAGTLTVRDGGRVSNTGGILGCYGGSTGTATVEGPGSTWTSAAGLYVGHEGTGALTVRNGGSVTAADFLWCGVWGTGTLILQSGGSVSNTIGILGYYGGSSGTATVDGAGSTWVNSSNLNVGLQGSGSLTVQNGGSVSNVIGYVGYWNWPGSRGTVTVDGAGSTWTNGADLYIGLQGSGTLTVRNGGGVSNVAGYLGYYPDSSGAATVEGTGSTWTSSGSLCVGGTSTEAGGSGGLTISNGGEVRVGGTLRLWGAGTVTLAGGTLSIDSLVKDGTFVWTGGALEYRSAGGLTLGAGGPFGTALTIPGGGALIATNGLTIQGGAALSASGAATVAGTVANNGTVNGPPAAGDWLAFFDAVCGTGNYTGNVAFRGGFSPGTSPAAVTGEFLLFGPGNTLTMELGGPVQGIDYDYIAATGGSTFGGTLDVELIAPFAPGLGSTFDLFDGPMAGSFAAVNLPPLGLGLAWDTRQLYTLGQIGVVLSTDIPEPCTLPLLALGCLGLLARRRRKWA